MIHKSMKGFRFFNSVSLLFLSFLKKMWWFYKQLKNSTVFIIFSSFLIICRLFFDDFVIFVGPSFMISQLIRILQKNMLRYYLWDLKEPQYKFFTVVTLITTIFLAILCSDFLLFHTYLISILNLDNSVVYYIKGTYLPIKNSLNMLKY